MKGRNYGIDLLRLVLMYMVCLLHTLGQGGILDAAVPGSASFGIYWLLETFAYSSVDSFAMISGYTASGKPQRYGRIVELWFQVFFYSFVLTAVFTLAGLNPDRGPRSLIHSALPVITGEYWYFTAYVALFFAMPLLDRFLLSADEVTARRSLIVIGILYSGFGVLTDPFQSMGGYSAIWIIVMYCVGALARRAKLFESRRGITLIVVWALCMLIGWSVKMTTGIGRLINYVSPTVALPAIIMVVLFARLKPNPKFVQALSPLAFGVYLFQLNPVVWAQLLGAFTFVAAMPPLTGVLCALGLALGIFLAGLAVEFLRSHLAKLLQINRLSQLIADKASRGIDKLLFLLK